jgi:prepilin-type N-terminal cleavage/methylation domain-containing protein
MRHAFTLIELLVVVTVIVLLLALLTPALDKAVYQAELTVCATRLRTIATGSVTYAFDYRRAYPHRPGVRDDTAWAPAMIYNGFDVLASDRDTIKGGDVQTTHPDHESRTANKVDQDGLWTSSAWKSSTGRGPEDLNYAVQDGSVLMYRRVSQIDSEMAYIPEGLQGHNGWLVTMPPQK